MVADDRRKTDALHAITAQQQIIADAAAELERQIARALHYGATWAELAAVLGVTRQSAHERYRWLHYDPTRRRAWHDPLPL